MVLQIHMQVTHSLNMNVYRKFRFEFGQTKTFKAIDNFL